MTGYSFHSGPLTRAHLDTLDSVSVTGETEDRRVGRGLTGHLKSYCSRTIRLRKPEVQVISWDTKRKETVSGEERRGFLSGP